MAEQVGVPITALAGHREAAAGPSRSSRTRRRPSSGGGRHLRAHSWMHRNPIDKTCKDIFKSRHCQYGASDDGTAPTHRPRKEYSGCFEYIKRPDPDSRQSLIFADKVGFRHTGICRNHDLRQLRCLSEIILLPTSFLKPCPLSRSTRHSAALAEIDQTACAHNLPIARRYRSLPQAERQRSRPSAEPTGRSGTPDATRPVKRRHRIRQPP